MLTITIHDQTTSGTSTNELTLDLLTEQITVRELIRSRIYQEVQDFNRQQLAGSADRFHGLVQPTDAEILLNGSGYKLKTSRQIDWKPQFEKACEAFEQNRILILIDGRQAESLDEEITLRATSTFTFLKLTPLVGG